MKIKLLKKIRKRYEIIKVDDIGSDASEYYFKMKNVLGLPFYVLHDTEDDIQNMFDEYKHYFSDYNDAYSLLVDWINDAYSEQFRHKDEVSSKVWWK